MERINCEYAGCNSVALLVSWRKALCGNHFMLIKNKLEKKENEEINNIIENGNA
jgi:hypothetical protein